MQTSKGVLGHARKTCIFLFTFAFSKFSRRVAKLHEKGHFARVQPRSQTCVAGVAKSVRKNQWYKIPELISYFMLSQSNVQCICRKQLDLLACH